MLFFELLLLFMRNATKALRVCHNIGLYMNSNELLNLYGSWARERHI